MRENTRPTQPLQRHFREKVRPTCHKTPILCHFSFAGRTISRSHPPSGRAGRTFARTGRGDVARLKPTAPLRPLMRASMKPPSPLLTPQQRPLKPTTPLQPKDARKTPISHPQRRRRFQTSAPRAATCPLPRKLARNSIEAIPQLHPETLKYQRIQFKFRNGPRGITCDIDADQTMPARRAPEGPEGQAAADVGGGGAWPGFETTRRAKLAARTARGRAAAHGHNKQPGPNRPHGARNTSGATSTPRTPAPHSKRGRHQPTPCASALTHP